MWNTVPLFGSALLPDFKERDFLMHWVTAPGTSHPEEVRISTAACIELRSIPGVRNCGSHIGQALLAEETAERQRDKEYWLPLRRELEKLIWQSLLP